MSFHVGDRVRVIGPLILDEPLSEYNLRVGMEAVVIPCNPHALFEGEPMILVRFEPALALPEDELFFLPTQLEAIRPHMLLEVEVPE